MAAGAGASQNVAYNIFNSIYSTTATMTAFGKPVTGATFAGGAIGAKFGNFEGVKGGALANIGTEIGFKALMGAAMGFATGATVSVLKKSWKDDLELVGGHILYGAIGGLSQAVTIILFGGPTYIPDPADFKEPGVAYRSGHFLWGQVFLLVEML